MPPLRPGGPPRQPRMCANGGKHLDLALQAGGHRFEPGTLHQAAQKGPCEMRGPFVIRSAIRLQSGNFARAIVPASVPNQNSFSGAW